MKTETHLPFRTLPLSAPRPDTEVPGEQSYPPPPYLVLQLVRQPRGLNRRRGARSLHYRSRENGHSADPARQVRRGRQAAERRREAGARGLASPGSPGPPCPSPALHPRPPGAPSCATALRGPGRLPRSRRRLAPARPGRVPAPRCARAARPVPRAAPAAQQTRGPRRDSVAMATGGRAGRGECLRGRKWPLDPRTQWPPVGRHVPARARLPGALGLATCPRGVTGWPRARRGVRSGVAQA